MKYKCALIFALLLLIPCMSIVASATMTDSNLQLLESETVEYDYDYDNDVYVKTVFQVYGSYGPRATSGYQYKNATHSKYFYIISTGEKVAEYTLTAYFRYDESAELAECRSTSTTGSSLVDGWSIQRASCVENVTAALGAGRGDYELYKNNNLNTTDTIVIYCDHTGKITKS